LVADWALAHLPLERIVGQTDPDNVASRTVMERLGFELIGPVGGQVLMSIALPWVEDRGRLRSDIRIACR
jgi:RimJ/RimL family protein N-acetyltransferase